MRHASSSQSSHDNTAVPGRVLGRCSWVGALCGLLGFGAGCGVDDLTPTSGEEVRSTQAAQLSDNGLSTNGLSTNGLSTNGLSTNGLSTNGLSTNGFATWFNQDPTTADSVMHYVVTCAAASTETRTFTNPVTGVTYTWTGGLGLAPAWANGSPATDTEKQVVSACLAAHANKYGLHVPISVLGLSANANLPIPYTAGELTTYPEKEACFFGNLFDGTGVFAAVDQSFLAADKSTPRTCGLASSSGQTDCAPIIQAGTCASLCTRAKDGAGQDLPYYSSCTYNGTQYRPITTRIRAAEIYQCGDGVCQFTERCGTGTTALSCQADCGACAP
ncbi:hypothetical protein LZ198_33205 [Myxococcus sp. K15C18031901]|uniref:hypothetical protein n=1 Tax=Myxococcus dinghuensis TaxID=2906761 RepID=UPI0020A7A1FA|nr:hypothetical protein [Myxococcus dinghuensis]MCP3103753.1 hypothetical protein [Myxococcus dinghuensis]